jgi:hypothetical protein
MCTTHRAEVDDVEDRREQVADVVDQLAGEQRKLRRQGLRGLRDALRGWARQRDPVEPCVVGLRILGVETVEENRAYGQHNPYAVRWWCGCAKSREHTDASRRLAPLHSAIQHDKATHAFQGSCRQR